LTPEKSQRVSQYWLRQSWSKIKLKSLKDKTQLVTTVICQLVLIHPIDLFTINQDGP